MRFVVDIDDTLIVSLKITCEKCGRVTYKTDSVNLKEIQMVNAAYDAGHTIILWTGRNWDSYYATKIQLEETDIKYHELVMGKPQGVYVDKDAIRSISEVL